MVFNTTLLPRITVIVPTFNRAASVQRFLASLDELEFSDSLPTEVIIVDNGSTDGTAEILLENSKRPHPFEFVFLRETARGKSNALNSGIAVSRGDLLIFADDDVVVDRHWLIKHWECHRDSDFDAVQGRVLPGLDPQGHPASQSDVREYNVPIVDYGDRIRLIQNFTGANASLKREVIEQVGLFNPRLGPGALGFSEDTEYSMRIRKAGFSIGYAPDAVVFHELSPERCGRTYHRRVEYIKGMGRSLYRQDSICFKVFPALLACCIRYGIYRVLGNAQKAYKSEGRIWKWWGVLNGKLGSSRLSTMSPTHRARGLQSGQSSPEAHFQD
ncbi:MAG TPA: glycosyltransferase family 2 protein [Nitrospira sp.]|nr:glycosyltransferase family 2 protein [Nitrospira sp.]